MSKELLKEMAAKEALRLVKDGVVLGLGSGTTMRIFAKLLAKKVMEEGINIIVIPTSFDIEMLSIKLGLKVASLSQYPRPDMAIDGADIVDERLNLIKGGGAALAREKVVDYSAREYIIIADESKLVKNIFSHKIPVEVLPFSWTSVTLFLKENLEAKAEIRMSREGKVGPITTDNGNFIIDVYIGKRGLSPAELEREVKQVPGVVEVGIFSLKKPKKVILGSASGVKVLTR